ncbi:D-serine ammonia-lyase [Acinetobacter baumannii]|nr:D-serine ammonia-lyase [Acinetobacter baumannii]
MNAVQIDQLKQQFPLIETLQAYQETFWFNPHRYPLNEALAKVCLTEQDVKEAEARLARFAPYLAKVFPETQAQHGKIESALVEIAEMQQALSLQKHKTLTGKLWLKKDSHLPISGSIKARGGIYEVLAHAEKLAIEAGLLKLEDDYSKLDQDSFRTFFSKYQIAVGSTGNLGLSIGIMSAKLGFRVSVHMSADARQWKKDKLRSLGVNVVEYASDYGVAVEEGRKAAEQDPFCFFIDDENSTTLFLGYGIFAEPTHSPCMLLGVYTGLHDQISVNDIGLDNITAADGLAVGRASGFVGRAMQQLIDGYYTIHDECLYELIALLNQTENIQVEPSAAAGMMGPYYVQTTPDYLALHQLSAEKLQHATHVVWATGGGMVPPDEMQKYLTYSQRN